MNEKIIKVKQGFSLREVKASRNAGILMSVEILNAAFTWLKSSMCSTRKIVFVPSLCVVTIGLETQI